MFSQHLTHLPLWSFVHQWCHHIRFNPNWAKMTTWNSAHAKKPTSDLGIVVQNGSSIVAWLSWRGAFKTPCFLLWLATIAIFSTHNNNNSLDYEMSTNSCCILLKSQEILRSQMMSDITDWLATYCTPLRRSLSTLKSWFAAHWVRLSNRDDTWLYNQALPNVC